MSRQFLALLVAVMFCLAVTISLAERPGAGKSGGRPGGEKPGGEKPGAGRSGGKPPGGSWSDSMQKSRGGDDGFGGQSEGKKPGRSSDDDDAAAGAAAANRKNPKPSQGDDAAAGAAAANRNNPKASGAEGAAAGAAASNRNNPKATGAEGAAAGAAAANRNNPKATGAEGAAAGAAAANRNNPRATGAEGAAAGAAAANRNSPNVSGAAGYAAVRNSFDRNDLYGQDWHTAHPGAWTAAAWPANAEWNNTGWKAAASHVGFAQAAPVSYNYGTNVTCVEGNVLVDGESVGTAEEFSQQASDLAMAGINDTTDDSDKWLPLGVFAMVRNEDQHPQLFLQMAVNQQGDVRGNYTDEATDHTLPIRGKVDTKTQRVAWVVGDKTSSVMEAGLSNLTDGEAPTLIHKNGKTDHWTLVRMPKPE